MIQKIAILTLLLVALAVPAPQGASAALDPESLVVHEWGTFTALHAEDGSPIAGVNSDDEPVPDFVHRVDRLSILGGEQEPWQRAKGVPGCHPDVTMRLETPVLYVYPPGDAKQPIKLDVRVRFLGGWLTEFYPDAAVEAPGLRSKSSMVGGITPETVGELHWKGLRIGGEGTPPETDAPVWLAPRLPRSALVTNGAGESESYLFYRGVGKVEAPLRVRREGENTLSVVANLPADLEGEHRVPWMGLVDIRDDGSTAYRFLGEAELMDARSVLLKTPARFEEWDYSVENRDRLRAEMHAALVGDGLFEDEARAMLDTWEASYFRSVGMRLFFIVPPAWTDHVLPLELARAADVDRVMVGRIEIVTSGQRELLGKIAAGPPADFHAFENLGRFRHALILDELARRPTAELRKFVETYRLSGYRLPD